MCYKSVIPSSWEVEIEGLQIQSQPGRLSKNSTHLNKALQWTKINNHITDANKSFGKTP